MPGVPVPMKIFLMPIELIGIFTKPISTDHPAFLEAENEVKELERKALRAAKKTAKKEELAEEVKVEDKKDSVAEVTEENNIVN
jgi:sensor histidine kinase regulating citrate/malate metabolism